VAQRKKRPQQRPGASRPAPRGATAKRPPARQGAQAGTRAAASRPFLTPGGSPFRHAVERRSATAIVFLNGLPRALPGLFVLGLLALALLAPPLVSALALLLVAALLGWLVFLSWPGITFGARAVRVVVIALVLGYAAARLTV
jgi:hypothetical protein